MENKINDGGPAFPTSKRKNESYMDESGYSRTRTVTVECGGMSLRDYFAAKAMASFMISGTIKGGRVRMDEHCPEIARIAYQVADAMLEARNGK